MKIEMCSEQKKHENEKLEEKIECIKKKIHLIKDQIKAIDVRIFELNAEKCSLEKYIQEDLRNLECKKMEH